MKKFSNANGSVGISLKLNSVPELKCNGGRGGREENSEERLLDA